MTAAQFRAYSPSATACWAFMDRRLLSYGVRRWKRYVGTPPPLLLGQLVGGGYHATAPQLRNMSFVLFVGAEIKVYHCPLA